MDGSIGNGAPEGEIPHDGNVVAKDAPQTTTPERSGGWRSIFKRLKPSETPSIPGEQLQDEAPLTEAAALTPEAEEDPEVLKDSLRNDLMRVVNLQVEAHFQEDDIRMAPSRSSEDPEFMKEKIERERMRAEARELSTALIGKLDSARGVLGNFCAVVGEGKKAVILRAPLTEEIVKTVVRGKNAGGTEGEPLYRTRDMVNRYFYLNGEGVFSNVVVNADAHQTESVGNKIFESRDFQDNVRLAELAKSERSRYDYQERDWRSKMDLVFKSEEEVAQDIPQRLGAIVRGIDGRSRGVDPRRQHEVDIENTHQLERRMYALRSLTDPYAGIEGKQEYDSALAEPLAVEIGFNLGGKSLVSTSYDVAAAFDASVDAGKNYKGDKVPGMFFDGQSPVSAEPMGVHADEKVDLSVVTEAEKSTETQVDISHETVEDGGEQVADSESSDAPISESPNISEASGSEEQVLTSEPVIDQPVVDQITPNDPPQS